MNRRSSAQLATALIAFFRHARLQHVSDPRQARGRRYSNTCFLRTILTSLVCGCTGLQAAEQLAHTLSPAARRLLAIPRNISDTALRYWLLKVNPNALRCLLRHVACHMHTTARIRHDAFPYAAVALDAKETFTSIHDATLIQRRQRKASLRTLTVCLISSSLNPCLDTIPLPPTQNERSAFAAVFQDICKHFGNMFQLITYDAGVCSQSNATLVHEANRGYVWALKNNQGTLFEEAKRRLGKQSAHSCLAQNIDCISGKVVTRRVWLHTVFDDTMWWSHIRTVIRVQTHSQDKKTQSVTSEDRYFISNIPRATPHTNTWVCTRNKHVLQGGK